MCWKGRQSNYQEISDFIDSNKDNIELLKFEEKLADISLLDYQIYNYRFKEKMTFASISVKLNISTARISESLNSISLLIQMCFIVN